MMVFKRLFAFALLTQVIACTTFGPGGSQPQARRQSLFGSLAIGSENQPAEGSPNAQPGGLPLPRPRPSLAPEQQDVASQHRAPVLRMGGRELTHVDGNVWRTNVDAVQVFSMLSRSLSQNYLLTSVDRKNLSLNTDWDKFFIDGRLFRNRLSISVFPVGSRQTEVVVKNTVEYFSGNPNKPDQMSAANWLPSPDLTDEVSRVVDSLNKQIAYYSSQGVR